MAHHTFETSLSALLGVLLNRTPSIEDQTSRVCVVRDLRARLRLVLEPNPQSRPDLPQIQTALERELGKWFYPPILSTLDGSVDEKRLAQAILNQAKPWPFHWTKEGALTASPPSQMRHPTQWCAVQKMHSKHAWLSDAAASPPWQLTRTDPAILAFHSFKGGVGRTTTLAIIAYLLAQRGSKVVCIDLDLEAPGLGQFLGVHDQAPGVLDLLLKAFATEQAGGLLKTTPALQTSPVHPNILCIPAGPLDQHYLEKLARLDFISHAEHAPSPVSSALKAILLEVKDHLTHPHSPTSYPQRTYILIDCRAGLHDIGGLSLNDLSLVDVLVGRNNPQGRQGLHVVLGALARRRLPQDRRVIITQTFSPLPQSTAEHPNTRDYRQAVYDMCQTAAFYPEQLPLPGIDDDQADHFPWAIFEHSDFNEANDLQSLLAVNPSPPRDYDRLLQRIIEICEP